MIACSKCGKDNQDHYKFCLGCGSEISGPPAAAAPTSAVPLAPISPNTPRKTAQAQGGLAAGRQAVLDAPLAGGVSPTPPAGVPQIKTPSGTRPPVVVQRGSGSPIGASSVDEMPLTEPNVASAGAGAMVACAGCGTPNPKEFVFCGNCGARVQQAQPQRTMQIGAKAKPAVEPRALGKMSLIRPDGSEGGIHVLRDVETMLGRGAGPLFDHDAYLSPTHTRIAFEADHVVLEDVGSLNGLFVKISLEESLRSGDIFRIGQELLRFDAILEPQLLEDGTEIMGSPNPGYWGRLSVIMGPGVDGSAFPLMGEEMVLGRERGDILFSDDGYVSGTHAKLSVREDGYFLVDLGSSNGTFIRITEPRAVPTGTFVLMGQQLFRIEML